MNTNNFIIFLPTFMLVSLLLSGCATSGVTGEGITEISIGDLVKLYLKDGSILEGCIISYDENTIIIERSYSYRRYTISKDFIKKIEPAASDTKKVLLTFGCILALIILGIYSLLDNIPIYS